MRLFFVAGTLSAFLAVVLGAFAAHELKDSLSADALKVFETGVRYQMYHALAMLLLPALSAFGHHRWLKRAGWGFLVGSFLFSGSLYMLATTGQPVFGPVTPVGGVAFIIGWLCLFAASLRGFNND